LLHEKKKNAWPKSQKVGPVRRGEKNSVQSPVSEKKGKKSFSLQNTAETNEVPWLPACRQHPPTGEGKSGSSSDFKKGGLQKGRSARGQAVWHLGKG